MLLSRGKGLTIPDATILELMIPDGMEIPFQRLIKLYLQQVLKTSCANPLLKFEKLSLLCESILCGIDSVRPFNTFQKYLSFKISRRQASGSTPQKRRTIEGEVERGQLIMFSKSASENAQALLQNHLQHRAVLLCCSGYKIKIERSILEGAL